MKVPKLVKALVLSSALFALASPAYAEMDFTPISNKLTTTFKIAGPMFKLQWTDSSYVPTSSDTLPEIDADKDEVKDLYMKATVNQHYDYIIQFKIKKTDGSAISEDDVSITDLNVAPSISLENHEYDDNAYLITYSINQSIDADPGTQDLHFQFKFNTAGDYTVEAQAGNAPA